MSGSLKSMSEPRKTALGYASLIAGLIALGLNLADFKMNIFQPPPPPEQGESLTGRIQDKISGVIDKYLKKEDKIEEEKEAPPPPEPYEWGPALYKTSVGLAILGVLSGIAGWARGEDHRIIIAGMGSSVVAVSWGNIIFGISVGVALAAFVALMKHFEI